MKIKFALMIGLVGLIITACSATPTPYAGPTLTYEKPPTIAASGGYRPLQVGDVAEGAVISYQYVLPSLDKPVVTLAFGPNLLQLILVKEENAEGLAAFVKELPKDKQIYAFDESNPTQAEPKLTNWDVTKPVEFAFIPLPEAGEHFWSVTEGDDQGIHAAYKIVRRKDGGLRFVDAYGYVALQSANNTFTLNGGGTGLMFSARLAVMKTILSDTKYQRGTNVTSTFPIPLDQYDKRVLELDTSRTGLAMNRNWVLMSRPGPNPGMVLPP